MIRPRSLSGTLSWSEVLTRAARLIMQNPAPTSRMQANGKLSTGHRHSWNRHRPTALPHRWDRPGPRWLTAARLTAPRRAPSPEAERRKP